MDPITREVVRGWLDSAAEEMQAALIKTAHSMLVAEGSDATAALLDRRGRTIAQAASIPVHLGVMVELGRLIAERYPPGVAEPGDLYVTNDPYAGGTHLPDIAVAAPVFHDGALAGYALTMAHHADVGGFMPGSVNLRARDIHAEGLRLPLLRVARAGVVNDDLMRLIVAASRVPRSLEGDLAAQVAGCRTGERRLAELYRRLPRAVIEDATDSLLDQAERMTRAAIAALPRGRASFVDHMDDDGLDPEAPPARIAVSVEARGDELEFDFTGSSPQVKAAINNVAGSTRAVVYYAVRTLTGDRVPNNDGGYRPVHITLPAGSIVNASYPAPVGSRGVALKRIESAVLGALAALVPERMPAAHSGQYTIVSVAGRRPDGSALVGHLGGPYAGGNGAQPRRDGIDCSDHGCTNGTMIAIEDAETRLPLRFRQLELWTDSGGAGQLRGGLGYRASIEWLGEPITATLRRERMRFTPQGLGAGGAAPPCRTALEPRGEPARALPGKVDFPMQRGDQVHYWTTGGGGRGPATGRAAARVLEDVLDGRVSADAARELYRVAIVDGAVDEHATARLRAQE